MQNFREIKPEELTLNPFQAIGSDWMLLTVSDGDGANPMTASWGGLGILWNRPAVFVFIRESRYTKGLMDKEDVFSLAFMAERYRPQLKLCGAKSGRDMDKAGACGFRILREEGIPYIAEAHTVLFCRKLYRQVMAPEAFLYPFPERELYDTAYAAEIEKIWRI